MTTATHYLDHAPLRQIAMSFSGMERGAVRQMMAETIQVLKASIGDGVA